MNMNRDALDDPPKMVPKFLLDEAVAEVERLRECAEHATAARLANERVLDAAKAEVERLRRDLFIAKKVVCRLYNVVLGVRARFSAVKLEARLEKYLKDTRREIVDDLEVPELKANLDYYKEP